MSVADFLESLSRGIWQTISITATAFVLGALLGFPLALLRRSGPAPVRWLTTAFIEVFRSVPPLVLVFLAYYSVSIGSLRLSTYQAAVLGLGIVAAAYLAEIFRAGINAVHPGQWEAANALGIPQIATYVRVVLPQAVLVAIPPAATFGIGLLKDSAVASVIGAEDITFYAFQETQATLQGLTVFLIAAGLYIALSVPVALLARWSDAMLTRRLGGA